MQQEETPKKKSKIAYIFGLLMIAIYFGMSGLFLFTKFFDQQFERNIQISLGIALLLYGIFRAYRIIKQTNNDEV